MNRSSYMNGEWSGCFKLPGTRRSSSRSLRMLLEIATKVGQNSKSPIPTSLHDESRSDGAKFGFSSSNTLKSRGCSSRGLNRGQSYWLLKFGIQQSKHWDNFFNISPNGMIHIWMESSEKDLQLPLEEFFDKKWGRISDLQKKETGLKTGQKIALFSNTNILLNTWPNWASEHSKLKDVLCTTTLVKKPSLNRH